MDDVCVWYYRPGKLKTHWAHPSCNPIDSEYNYLSKIIGREPREHVADDCYNHRECPRCGRRIKMNYSLLDSTIKIKEGEQDVHTD